MTVDTSKGPGKPGEGELVPKEVGGFRILRRLASGASSDVLLARAEGPHGFQRVVALKMILARSKEDDDFERNFAAQASAYARLSHPAVVKLYDFFSADGQLVLVLEYVDGLPLHKLRAMLAIAGQRVEDKASLFLGLRIFSALAAAHQARDPALGEFAPIVHYDVNPSNILIPWDGHVKLGDFGIARAAGIQTDARAGFIKGTYGYNAPEQVSGKNVGLRADVYSAGLILWELLARRKAVQRGSLNDAQVTKAMAYPEYPSLDLLRPDLDASLREAVRRTLEPDPEKRSITAEEMMNVLRQAVQADDGRKALAEAIARVRSIGSDPLASTAPLASMGPGQARASQPPAGTLEDRLDPEQTGPVPAVLDDGGDLGKIAFYGRIKLPAESEPPRASLTSTPPVPRSPSVPPVDSPVVAVKVDPVTLIGGGPPPRSLSPKPSLPAQPLTASVRPVPRPVVERKPSSPSYPFVAPSTASAAPPPAPAPLPISAPPPAVRGEGRAQDARAGGVEASQAPISANPSTDPLPAVTAEVAVPANLLAEASGAPPPVAPASPEPPVAPTPSPAPEAGEPPVAPVHDARPEPDPFAAPAVVPPTVQASSPALSPPTERSPEVLPSTPPAVDVGAPGMSASGSVRPNAPPYVVSSIAPPPRRAPWALIGVAAVVLAGGGVLLLGQGDSVTAPAPVAATGAPSVPIASAPAVAPSAPPPPQAAPPSPQAPLPAPSVEPTASVAASPSPAPPPASAPAPSPSPSAAAAPARSAAPEPASHPSSSPPVADLAPDMGEIVPPAAAAGHRVFVDGKVAGEGVAPVRLRCGAHQVKVGSAGVEKKVDVPCGGSVRL